MRRDPRDWALVVAQLVAGAALFLPGTRRWRLPRSARVLGVAAVAGGAALGVAGGVNLGAGLSPFPTPKPSAQLRTTGAFRISRHPIYTGLIAAAVGTTVLRQRSAPVVACGLLVATLSVKVRYEERRLRERFGTAYDDYASRVPRLMPRAMATHRSSTLPERTAKTDEKRNRSSSKRHEPYHYPDARHP